MFNNWASSKKVTRYMTWEPYKQKEDVVPYISMCINNYSKADYMNWVIQLKENNQAIGNIGVVEIRKDISQATIGYCLGESYWHKGIMSEAFTRVIQFLFEEVDINRITATHDTRNPNSGKVMAKCGLRYEGTHRQAAINISGIIDSAVYAILKEDYIKK